MLSVNNLPNQRFFLLALTIILSAFVTACTVSLPSSASLDFDPQSLQRALASRSIVADEVQTATVRAIYRGKVLSISKFLLSDGGVKLEVPTSLELEFVLEAELKSPKDGIRSWGFHDIVYLPAGTQRFKIDAPLRPLTSAIIVPEKVRYFVFDQVGAKPQVLTSNVEQGPLATPIGYDRSARLFSFAVLTPMTPLFDYQYLVPAVTKPFKVELPGAPQQQTSAPVNFSPSWDFSSWFVLQKDTSKGDASLLELPINKESTLPSALSKSLVDSRYQPFSLAIKVPTDDGKSTLEIAPDLLAMVSDSEGFWYLSGRYNYTKHKLNFGFVLKLEVVPGRGLDAKWKVLTSYPEKLQFTFDAEIPYKNDVLVKDLLVRGPYLYVLDAGVSSAFGQTTKPAIPMLYRLDRKSLNIDRINEAYSSVVKSPVRFVNQHGWLLTVASESNKDGFGNLFQVGFDLQAEAIWNDYEVPAGQ